MRLQIEWPQQWPAGWSPTWPTGWSVAWITAWWEEETPITAVDFGEGRMVSAADLLDGHFQRLAATPLPRPTTVPPAESQLHTTIAVVAPTLTPLTDLAETVAQNVPVAQPTPHFRDTLHKALEQTHRQHQAQRVLGIQAPAVESNPTSLWLFFGIAVALVGICLALYSRRYLLMQRQ